MKKPFNPVLPQKEEKEVKLDFKPCSNCGKKITDGYYGRFGDGGVCSKTCNAIEVAKPRYPKGGQNASVSSRDDPQSRE